MFLVISNYMKIGIVSSLLAVCVCSAALAQGDIHASDQSIEDQLHAIRMAYERLARENIETRSKTIVIGEHRGLLTVSFINSKPQYGGQTHVVYDPKTKSVVSLYAEE